MAVDTETLRTDLEEYGNIDFCDVNNDKNYVIVMNGVSQENYTELFNLIDFSVTPTYPDIHSFDLNGDNGVLKVECKLEEQTS